MIQTLKEDYRNIRSILRHVAPWRTKYVAGLLVHTATNFVNTLLIGLIMGSMLKNAQAGQYSAVVWEALKWFGLIVVNLVIGAISDYLFADASLRATSSLKRRLFAHMVNLPYRVTSKTHTGDHLSRLDSDASLCADILEWLLASIVGSLLTLVLGIVTVSAIHWQISLALILVGLVMMGINLVLVGKSSARWKATQEQRGATLSYMSDLLAGAQLVRIYGEDTGLMARFIQSCRHLFQKSMRGLNISATYYGFNQVNAGLTTACSIGLGLVLYSQGAIGIAMLPVLIQVGATVVGPISGIGWILIDLQQSLAGARRVSEILNQAEEDIHVEGVPLRVQDAAVEAKNLSFRYDDGKEPLRDVTFAVAGGQTCGIAGYSGSGKSTLLRLLMGIDGYQGSLTIGGLEVRDMKLAHLRGLSAYVPQECPLFDGSIMENIRLGNLDATDQQVIEAAKAADVDGFVQELPQGYHTQVGENGVKLSGGQRQRIAIARAMLKNAPLLLLDEVTASLDSATEQRVKDALQRLMKGRTTIIVAHRLSTITHADQVLFMENGQVVENGTHGELLNQDGQYAQLYSLQSSLAEEVA